MLSAGGVGLSSHGTAELTEEMKQERQAQTRVFLQSSRTAQSSSVLENSGLD